MTAQPSRPRTVADLTALPEVFGLTYWGAFKIAPNADVITAEVIANRDRLVADYKVEKLAGIRVEMDPRPRSEMDHPEVYTLRGGGLGTRWRACYQLVTSRKRSTLRSCDARDCPRLFHSLHHLRPDLPVRNCAQIPATEPAPPTPGPSCAQLRTNPRHRACTTYARTFPNVRELKAAIRAAGGRS